jgi:hypothetical protein
MSTAPKYTNQWTPMEETCKGCGTKYRLDVEFVAGPFAAQEYQHCANDQELNHVPGPIIAVWEWRNGDWVLVSDRSQ